MLAVSNRLELKEAQVTPALRTSQLDIDSPYGAGSIDLSREYVSATPAPQGGRLAPLTPEENVTAGLATSPGRSTQSLDLQPLADHRFSGFEMLARPGQDEGLAFTERITNRVKDGLTLGSAFDLLTMPSALGSRSDGPNMKTQGNGVREDAAAINLAEESFSFAA